MRLLVVLAAFVTPALGAPPVTLDSLLKEMVDRDAMARFPNPEYTCKQFSSYDRASKTPQDEKGWFANGDANQYLRVELAMGLGPGNTTVTRREWVLMDSNGPGAVVRIWSANPKGTLRVYLDRSPNPAIEAPMEAILGGTWGVGDAKVAAPLAGMRSRGWNLYFPIPYAEHCKITSDSDGFYYQINYRTYQPGTNVVSYSAADLGKAAPTLADVQKKLTAPPQDTDYQPHDAVALAPGESHDFPLRADASGAITGIQIEAEADDVAQALRSVVMRIAFDGQETVWCPLGDFFASGVGRNEFRTWWTSVIGSKFECDWVMPFERSARITLHNTGKAPARVQLRTRVKDWSWDDRSMHFHATWHAEHPIHAYGGRGTKDFNFVEIVGRGVYAGDSLAVMNPVPEWWGEGDEKVFVDGESFPSHFGTGTEDYYGYAWCCPEPFTHPFHAQPRCDGHKEGNNWGHTSVMRVRSLDAITFNKSLRMDMEVWHWRESDVAYAATAYFYAQPGATTNRSPQPEASGAPIPKPTPLPPPFKIDGAIECESAKVVAKSDGLSSVAQDMRQFGRGKWSGEAHLWVQGRRSGDFVELEIPTGEGPEGRKPVGVTVYATKSWDYGVVRLSVNGQQAGADKDLFSGGQGKCEPTGAIELGTFTPTEGKLTLRAEVVGGNEKALGSKSFFGLDCVVLTPK